MSKSNNRKKVIEPSIAKHENNIGCPPLVMEGDRDSEEIEMAREMEMEMVRETETEMGRETKEDIHP